MVGPGALRRRRAPYLAGALVLLLLAAVAATGGGFRLTRLSVTGNTAWLASSAVGLATLVDGSSGEVVGSLRVAEPGGRLSTTQADTSAFISDARRGTVTRVDGRTYEKSDSVAFTGATESLRVYAAGATLLVLDGERGLLTRADTVSLAARDKPEVVAPSPGPRRTALDSTGHLWLVSQAGDLVRIDGGAPGTRTTARAADAHARLVVVRGSPVLVRDGGVAAVSETGEVSDLPCRTGLDPGTAVTWSGSAKAPRLYGSVRARGVLLLIDLDGPASGCLRAVPVGEPGHDLGEPVEAAGAVLVPDRTAGTVAVVDPASGAVTGPLDLEAPGAPMELTAGGDVAYYNDPDSERAGVIRLTDGRWRATPVDKYEPERPEKDLFPTPRPSNLPTPTPTPPPGEDPTDPTPPPGTRSTTPSTGGPSSTTGRPTDPRTTTATTTARRTVSLTVTVDGPGRLTARQAGRTLRGCSTGAGSGTCRWTVFGGTSVDVAPGSATEAAFSSCPTGKGKATCNGLRLTAATTLSAVLRPPLELTVTGLQRDGDGWYAEEGQDDIDFAFDPNGSFDASVWQVTQGSTPTETGGEGETRFNHEADTPGDYTMTATVTSGPLVRRGTFDFEVRAP